MHIQNVSSVTLCESRNRLPIEQGVRRDLRLLKWLPTFAAAVLLLQSVGCVSGPSGDIFQDQMGTYRNHVWARRAYNLRYGHCEREYTDDFRQGFIDGYTNVCDGGDGYVPAVPPQGYWSTQYQSPEGAKCVNTWFKSYPLGVKAAREDSAGAFNEVFISKMVQSAIVQDKADHVLPDDVPVVSPESKTSVAATDSRFTNDPSFEAANVNLPTGQRTAGTGTRSRPISNR